MPNRFWPAGGALELSHYALRRPFPTHLHPEAVVAVVTRGAEALSTNGACEAVRAGEILVLEPACAHANYPVDASGAVYRVFYVEAERLRAQGALPGRLRSHVVRNRALTRRLLELHRSLEHGSAVVDAGVPDELVQALAALPVESARFASPDAVTRAAAVLRERCAERLHWPLVARNLGYSPGHLARLFSRHHGIAPYAFQTQFRIAEAKRRLRAGEEIAPVSAACGFADQSHLTNRFMHYVGQSPGAYAERRNLQDAARLKG